MNALSRLNHRFIVRYYTTWVETSEPTSAVVSDEDDSSESGYATEDGMTSVPSRSRVESRETSSGPVVIFNMDDLDDVGSSSMSAGGSFPSIHFTRSGSGEGTEEEDDTDSDGDGQFGGLFKDGNLHTPLVRREVQRTLYIQMVKISF